MPHLSKQDAGKASTAVEHDLYDQNNSELDYSCDSCSPLSSPSSSNYVAISRLHHISQPQQLETTSYLSPNLNISISSHNVFQLAFPS